MTVPVLDGLALYATAVGSTLFLFAAIWRCTVFVICRVTGAVTWDDITSGRGYWAPGLTRAGVRNRSLVGGSCLVFCYVFVSFLGLLSVDALLPQACRWIGLAILLVVLPGMVELTRSMTTWMFYHCCDAGTKALYKENWAKEYPDYRDFAVLTTMSWPGWSRPAWLLSGMVACYLSILRYPMLAVPAPVYRSAASALLDFLQSMSRTFAVVVLCLAAGYLALWIFRAYRGVRIVARLRRGSRD